jgi:hypothetical protein
MGAEHAVVEIPVDNVPLSVSMFWCVGCKNVLAETPEVCHSIVRAVFVGPLKRIYRTGFCRPCAPAYTKISPDDLLELHEALAEMTSLIPWKVIPVEVVAA